MLKFEFRVTCGADDRLPGYLDMSGAQIKAALGRHWSMLNWTVTACPSSDGPACMTFNTPDPKFDPDAPVRVNGFLYAPVQRTNPPKTSATRNPPGWSAEFRDPIAYPSSNRQRFCGPARQESDEYVCPTAGCGLRWAIDEERPECPL